MRAALWNAVSGLMLSMRIRRAKRFRLLKKIGFGLAGRSLVNCGGFKLRINDGPNFYMQFKDEFLHGIYRFKASGPTPLIIDGGSNMGMSILAFKRAHPDARVIGFEPDPEIFALLKENVERNELADVRLVNAGLAEKRGTLSFAPDAAAGGQLVGSGAGAKVNVEPLSDYLGEEVDFLKLNIEGMELPVLQEAAASGRLRNVRELVLEYHGWPKGAQHLGEILTLLDREGFRYLIHDFDAETCGTSKPPFRLPETPWFCLVYAKRVK
jgi:FkbM family methyltransferase